jgi:hypothetical protein
VRAAKEMLFPAPPARGGQRRGAAGRSICTRTITSAMGILTRPEEFEAWLAAPVEEALALQRPLPAELLTIVASDSTKDEGPVALAV